MISPKPLPKKSPSAKVGGEDTMIEGVPDSIEVCVRVRPLLRDEVAREEPLAWAWNGNVIAQAQQHLGPSVASRAVSDTHPRDTYQFDHLFTPETTNTEIYATAVHPMVERVMQGLHGSIFTYGQTSSGKTFTMNGSAKQPGIIPQTIYDCFEYISAASDREFLFRVSYLEVYNETVNDLLNPQPAQIRIMHDPKLGTVLHGVKEQIVMTAEQVIALLQGGEAHRHVGSTDMNEKSSRAHTLFRLIVESKERAASVRPSAAASKAKVGSKPSSGGIRVSTLNLIDLAGSENAKMANTSGKAERGREGKFINQSLLALSTIIQRLSEEKAGGQKQHIPYRDSKLTRILQAPLSGNAMICIICTVSPSLRCAEESHNTLKFASRAKRITVDAKVNESFDEKALLRKYREEIDTLTAKLAEMETMVQQNKLEKEDRGSDESDEEDDNKQEIMLQMIDHMERLILKGGGGKDQNSAMALLRTPLRTGSLSGDLSMSGRGSKSGLISAEGSARTPQASSSPSASSAAIKILERADTYDDPFHDLAHEGGRDGEETDFFVGRQRQNSFDLKTDSSDLDNSNPAPGSSEGPDKLNLPNRPNRLSIPMRKSVSLVSDSSVATLSPPPVGASSGDSALLGVQQMLSLLRSQVTKPKHHHHQHRTLDDMDTPPRTPDSVASTNSKQRRRHSMMPQSSGDFSRGLSSEFSTPLTAPPESPKLGSAASRKTPDAQKVDKLALDLKLKNADNKFLQDELDKANLQIAKKDRILSALTEGLKEVEINQSQLVASRDDLAGELEMARDFIQRILKENEDLKEELHRLNVFISMEKTMKQSGTLSQMPSFASFDHRPSAASAAPTSITEENNEEVEDSATVDTE